MKQLYDITEVCAMLGTTSRTLRYYEDQGLITSTLKECNESEYWLELLYSIDCLTEKEFSLYKSDCIELRRLLVSFIRALKESSPP